MSDSVEARVRQIAADIFDLPLEQISDTTSPQTVGNWDSVQHLNLVLALEQGMGVQIAPEDIERMRDVGAIVQLVREKLPQ